MSVQQLNPVHMARLRRVTLPKGYFQLNEATVIAGAVVIVCLLSIMYLAQTGRVATAGYGLQVLQQENTALLRESEQYEYRIARASKLDVIAERAQKLGLRPASSTQQRFARIEIPAVPVVATR